jgi:DNA-binding NtrC family response regulator
MNTILLVDDDPLQAHLRKAFLERHYPDVERVSDAAEALCLVGQPHFAKNLCLVISGLNLPGLRGPAFIAELHERMPQVRVLVLETNKESAADYRATDYQTGRVRFLARPFAGDQLLAATGEMLAQTV